MVLNSPVRGEQTAPAASAEGGQSPVSETVEKKIAFDVLHRKDLFALTRSFEKDHLAKRCENVEKLAGGVFANMVRPTAARRCPVRGRDEESPFGDPCQLAEKTGCIFHMFDDVERELPDLVLFAKPIAGHLLRRLDQLQLRRNCQL